MDSLRLKLEEGLGGEGHAGEVFALVYTSDSAFLLSGGWDGCLRLWDAQTGAAVTRVEASPKPLSACAIVPGDRQWLSGSMEGLLCCWDAAGHLPLYSFLAHTRPISMIRFAPDGKLLATTSWDRQLALRVVGKEREARMLAGHTDIVSGCRFTPDGKQLLSWSYDGTLILWDVEFGSQLWAPPAHDDRILSGAISPEGRWAATGSRDGVLKLWDIGYRGEAGGVPQTGELVACAFLLDGETMATVTSEGVVTLLGIPNFEVRAELETGVRCQTAELSPSGLQLALGGVDGQVHRVAILGLEEAEWIVTALPSFRQVATVFDRLLGKTRNARCFSSICPVCRLEVELSELPADAIPCPRCKRRLRLISGPRPLQVR